MIIKRVHKLSVFLAVAILVSACAIPAHAQWEVGANVTTAVVELASSDVAYTAETYLAKVFKLVNEARTDAGLNALTGLDALKPLADLRAAEASVQFSHKRPDGRSCGTVFADGGLYYSYAGENLAYGFAEPEALVKAWLNSKSHRDNLLSSNFLSAELGYYINENGTIYCSMLLYTAKAS